MSLTFSPKYPQSQQPGNEFSYTPPSQNGGNPNGGGDHGNTSEYDGAGSRQGDGYIDELSPSQTSTADSENGNSLAGNKRKGGPVDGEQTKKVKTTGDEWADQLVDFVLNGLYREKKVIFKDDELVYGGAIYKRVKLQFLSGFWPLSKRIDFEANESMKEKVEKWWEDWAKKTLREKLSQKKSNTLCAIKDAMRSKWDSWCWWCLVSCPHRYFFFGPKEWFCRLVHDRNGKGAENLPKLEEIEMGPFLVERDTRNVTTGEAGREKIVKVVDNRTYTGVNKVFLDMVFELQPALIGKTIWKGIVRCGRNPKFADKTKYFPTGTLEELLTNSDMAFLIWAFVNYYDVCKNNCEMRSYGTSHTDTVKPKFTRSATKKYDGWSDEGKRVWNYHMVEIRTVMKDQSNPFVGEFKEEFESRWKESVGAMHTHKSNEIVDTNEEADHELLESFA